ncbi:MAG TPA: hypothetical protein VF773_07105 [Verrucomicrobiae bacterium]
MKARILLLGLFASIQFLCADVIECDNGDRYNGKVLSMDEKSVILQNAITGKLTIPRARIVSIGFGDKPIAQATRPATNAIPVIPQRPGAVQFDPNTVQKIQQEYLATATPEAQQMFNQMIQGFASGQMNVADLQSKARSTLQELRQAQKELGDDEMAGLLDSYGAILENFLRAAPATTANQSLPRTTPTLPTPPVTDDE